MKVQHSNTPILLAATYVIACVLAVWGVYGLWLQAQKSSTAYLTNVIGELEKSQGTVARAWTTEFEATLRTLSDNSKYSAFVGNVTGMGLGGDVLLTLTGRESERRSMLALLQARRTPQEMVKLQAFADSSEQVRRDLSDLATRYGFIALYLFSDSGAPCMGTGSIPAKFRDISTTVVQPMAGGRNIAVSLPAYMSEGRLCADIAVPMLMTDSQNILTYRVGYLVVTVNLGDAIDSMRAAHNPEGGTTSLVLERQPDDSLIVLSSKSTQKVPLEGWTTTEDGVPFALRRIAGVTDDAFTLGRRLLTTSLYVVSVLPEDRAETLFLGADNSANLVEVSLWAVGFLTLVFVTWLYVFTRHERARRRAALQKKNNGIQNREILATVNRELGLGIACLDFDRHILFANSTFARLAGRDDANDLHEKSTVDLPQDLAMVVEQHMGVVWETEKTSSSEIRLSDRGTWKLFNVSASPYVDAEGYLAGVLVFCRDVSERVAVLQRCDALVDQTVASLHRLLAAMDPYAGRLTTLISEVALLVAQLDNDKTPQTERLLSMAGRLCLLGNTARAAERARAEGRRKERVVGISLSTLDFGGLPVQETIQDMYERLDGSGHPGRIKGDQIPKPARYLAIAEELCTIMHPRNDPFPTDWETACKPILDPNRFDPVAEKLVNYLKTSQGERILIRLRRK